MDAYEQWLVDEIKTAKECAAKVLWYETRSGLIRRAKNFETALKMYRKAKEINQQLNDFAKAMPGIAALSQELLLEKYKEFQDEKITRHNDQ